MASMLSQPQCVKRNSLTPVILDLWIIAWKIVKMVCRSSFTSDSTAYVSKYSQHICPITSAVQWEIVESLHYKRCSIPWDEKSFKVTPIRCTDLTGRAPICINSSPLSIYASVNWDCIGSDNGLLPDLHQAIIWTNAGILLIKPLGTNSSESRLKIQILLFVKMHWKHHFWKGSLFVQGEMSYFNHILCFQNINS